MTRPIIHGASRLALLLVLCVGFIGGALLFSHAHFFERRNPLTLHPSIKAVCHRCGEDKEVKWPLSRAAADGVRFHHRRSVTQKSGPPPQALAGTVKSYLASG